MTKKHSHPLTEYCLFSEDLTAKPYELDTDFLDDLGTLVLEPIQKPTNDHFEHLTENSETVVNIDGRWFYLTTLDDLKTPDSLTKLINNAGLTGLGSSVGNHCIAC